MSELLFVKHNLRDVLENQKDAVRKYVEELDRDYLLKANPEELGEYVFQKFDMESPQLLHDSIYVDEPAETEIDVAGDPRYDPGSSLAGRRPTVKGTRIVIHVPFQGEAVFFDCRSNEYSMNPPRARVGDGELLLVYTVTADESGENLRRRWQHDVSEIDQYLQRLRRDVDRCREELPGLITSVLTSRKSRLIANIGMVDDLGLPVRRSGDEIVAVSLPKKRRSAPVRPPKVTPGSHRAEPAIDVAEYDHILEVISHLTVAIERSPSAFRDMGEEQLRDHILIQLNGHYEGQATGETFNGRGKTDILVRVEGKNAFIGECKIWRGPQAFSESIDQLFGYSCWSDTKAAIIIFNRNRDHTKVLGAIRKKTSQHPKFKREFEHKAENHFRYLFEHPEDADRRIYIAVLAISLPR